MHQLGERLVEKRLLSGRRRRACKRGKANPRRQRGRRTPARTLVEDAQDAHPLPLRGPRAEDAQEAAHSPLRRKSRLLFTRCALPVGASASSCLIRSCSFRRGCTARGAHCACAKQTATRAWKMHMTQGNSRRQGNRRQRPGADKITFREHEYSTA